MVKLFCKHNWVLLQEKTTQSRAELEKQVTGAASEVRNTQQHEELYSRKLITILKCESCGKLKRYVEYV